MRSWSCSRLSRTTREPANSPSCVPSLRLFRERDGARTDPFLEFRTRHLTGRHRANRQNRVRLGGHKLVTVEQEERRTDNQADTLVAADEGVVPHQALDV